IETLFVNRQKVIKYLRGQPYLDPQAASTNKADQQFLEDVQHLVNDQLGDVGFNVEAMSQKLGMSKRNLQLKLKALIGKTPIELIREARMMKAVELLRKERGTIAEIAYQVGFADPAYFHRVFKQQYKLTPKQFMNHAKAFPVDGESVPRQEK
ncbi:MAG: helix-turn-helix transcriptional regulator, partial [Bacteroidota bacterium]